MKGILCFGDSITFGMGENPKKGWCGRLKEYFEIQGEHQRVYNLGIPGDTSTDLLQLFDTEAKGRITIKRPSDKYLIIIAIGTNDAKFDGMHEIAKPRITEEQFKKNITILIQKAKLYQAKIVFIGLPPIDKSKTSPYEETWFTLDRIKTMNNIVKSLCEEKNILFLDIFNLMIMKDYSLLLADGLHPNSKGYDYMFEKIKEFLEQNGLI